VDHIHIYTYNNRREKGGWNGWKKNKERIEEGRTNAVEGL